MKAAVVRAVAPGTGIAHPFLVPRLHRSLTLCASLLLVAACSDDDAAPPAPAPAPPPVTPAAPEPATAPSLACVEDDVAGSLARIEGVKDVAEMACGAYVRGATHCYSFTFQQPVDHGAKDDGATFAQRVRLVHRGCNAPTTIMDNGYSLPKVLYEFISSHHGTTLVQYFYHAAAEQRKTEADRAPDEVEFRYPGPKPRLREAAILMLADASESSVRAMADPTHGRIENQVHAMVTRRLMDGQLDECDLTLREVHLIETSLVKSLCSIYHTRLAYPTPSGQKPSAAELRPKKTADGAPPSGTTDPKP